MEFQDKALRCVDCGSDFIWKAGEQLFFADKQFKNEPKRSKACKAKRANRVNAGASRRDRIETQTTCSACGKDTTVPFRPTQGRPVFCKECFQQRKFVGAGGVEPLAAPHFSPSIGNHSVPDRVPQGIRLTISDGRTGVASVCGAAARSGRPI